jgi:hypothetical protein
MEFHTLLFHIAPLAEVSAEDFERALRDEVMPKIDTGQTRAGRITAAVVYRTSNGHYRLLVEVETVTGSRWARVRLQPAIDAIAEIGAIYAEDDMQRVVMAGDGDRGT